MKNYKVTVLHLKEFTKKVFAMTGLTEADADSVAELLVDMLMPEVSAAMVY